MILPMEGARWSTQANQRYSENPDFYLYSGVGKLVILVLLQLGWF